MPFPSFSLFRKKDRSSDEPTTDKVPAANEGLSQSSSANSSPSSMASTSPGPTNGANSAQPLPPDTLPATRAPHQYAPGTGPAANAQMHQANNLGMLSGAVIGSSVGDPVMGMVEGQVIGNMIGQRIQQEKKHAYYRDQALRYRDGEMVESVGMGPPGEKSSREQSRDERRRKRWERRAKSRDM